MRHYRIIQEDTDNPKFYVQYKDFLFWHYFVDYHDIWYDIIKIEKRYPTYAVAVDAIREDVEKRKKPKRKIFNINLNDL